MWRVWPDAIFGREKFSATKCRTVNSNAEPSNIQAKPKQTFNIMDSYVGVIRVKDEGFEDRDIPTFILAMHFSKD